MILHTYERGDELPGIDLPWQTSTGANLNLTAGYTFALVLQPVDGSGVRTVSAVPVGYDGGVRWTSWATSDLDINPGTYAIDLTATESATSKQRSYSPGDRPRIRIR